ncbi:MAG: crossover junction endodeoxyribonuclease RuvC [Candidatus Omnitrophica bacterium CG11_big_fil_rev_8_21_14_0_20_64_10]|nr:MAG: crossover junction endodeoxyribonuclease RuvC [Candidatus Omnitrophica bacterium CG11_big_fil_rev_8_21_14_0_20_64_10]
MRILGVDPGLDACGYGAIQIDGTGAVSLVEAGLIRTRKTDSLADRLAIVARELKRLILQHRPDVLAVEDLYSYYKTPKPSILMGHVRGVVLGTAASLELSVSSYLPTRVKRATVGRGHASKEQIARMVQMRLNLPATRVRADVTDALAVALCHADHLPGRVAAEGVPA